MYGRRKEKRERERDGKGEKKRSKRKAQKRETTTERIAGRKGRCGIGREHRE